MRRDIKPLVCFGVELKVVHFARKLLCVQKRQSVQTKNNEKGLVSDIRRDTFDVPSTSEKPAKPNHLEVLACPAFDERIQRRRLGSSNRRARTSQKRCPDWAQVSENSVSSNNGASERLRLFVPSRLWGFVSESMPTNLWRVICLSRMSFVSKTVNSFTET